MATSLYDFSVANYLQTLTGVSNVLDKGLKHLTAAGRDPDEFVGVRLAEDMLPFQFQIASVVHHSLGAIEGVKAGIFRPPPAMQPETYADLQAKVADTKAKLAALSRDEVNALEGKDVVFHIGQAQMPFTAEGFILSFSLPNFYFHAATTYDILRTHGTPLGKRDFMGPPRMKG